jgi:pyruvate/oxaloacetate carboxyltransferase/biotin carboxyl carrier protein
MNKIQFIDQTARDGQQSLWGNMMATDMILSIAETMDQVGYRNIATIGSQAFKVQVRNLGENPWERIRQMSKLIRKTPIRGSYQIGSLSSFDLSTPKEVIELWIRRSVANGIRSFWICDYQEENEKFVHFAEIARAEGAEVVTSLMYSISPVHTQEYWIRKTRLIAETKEFVDRIMIEDASGVMNPRDTREFVKTVQRHCEGIPLEFHGHCNSGLATQCYLEAIQEGVTTVHTAVAPLANGSSVPSTETILKNIRHLGFSTDLNEDALHTVSEYFRQIAQREGLPTGVPLEYDLFHFEHQVPGGMISNLSRQLREVGMEDRMQEILNEVVQVRKDLGYPVMATPFSQIVGIQAMENILSGKRYERIPDEVVKYVLGFYGKLNGPVDARVMRRIEQLPRTEALRGWKPKGYDDSIEKIRSEIGPDLDDDDLLLTILIPGYNRETLSKKTVTPSLETAKVVPPVSSNMNIPSEFLVDVDGEQFNVKVFPQCGDGDTGQQPEGGQMTRKEGKLLEIPPGAMISGIAGLVISIDVNVGDQVNEGDQVAMIEAMKMMRPYLAPHGGVVKEICVKANEMIDTEDILMIVE